VRVSDDGVFFEIGDRRWPMLAWVNDSQWFPVEDRWGAPGFWFRHRRVRLQFESGYSLSITWGDCTHGDNYDCNRHTTPDDMHADGFTEEPNAVEIAIFHKDHKALGTWPDGDLIQGYVEAERLLAIIESLDAGAPPVWFDEEGRERAEETMRRMTQNMREGRAPWEAAPADEPTTNTPDQGEP
jgi:hypothetical protein